MASQEKVGVNIFFFILNLIKFKEKKKVIFLSTSAIIKDKWIAKLRKTEKM